MRARKFMTLIFTDIIGEMILSGVQAALKHAKRDIGYPVTKSQFMQACNNLSDVPQADKEWLDKNLPDKTYNSPIEVFDALLERS